MVGKGGRGTERMGSGEGGGTESLLAEPADVVGGGGHCSCLWCFWYS